MREREREREREIFNFEMVKWKRFCKESEFPVSFGCKILETQKRNRRGVEGAKTTNFMSLAPFLFISIILFFKLLYLLLSSPHLKSLCLLFRL
jgi:hypothetical protein